MRTIAAFLAPLSLIGSLTSAHAQEERYFTETNTASELTDLGHGYSPNWNKVGPCFSVTGGVVEGGLADYSVEIISSDRSDFFQSTRSNNFTAGGGFKLGAGSASASYSETSSSTLESRRDETKVALVVTVAAHIRSEYAKELTLNQLGKEFAAQGVLRFQENCGVLVATELKKVVHIQIYFELNFRNENQKKTFQRKASGEIGGSYGAFNASGSFSNSLDQTISETRAYGTLSMRAAVRSQKPLAGASEFYAKIGVIGSNATSKTVATEALAAVSALLAQKGDDEGTVDQVVFQATSQYLPQQTLASWTSRKTAWARARKYQRYIETAKRVRRGFVDINAMLDYQQGSRELNLFQIGWIRACFDFNASYAEMTPSYLVCRMADAEGLDSASSNIDDFMKRCLAAENFEWIRCTDDNLLIATLPMMLFYQGQSINPAEQGTRDVGGQLNDLSLHYASEDVGFVSESVSRFRQGSSRRASEILDEFFGGFDLLKDRYEAPIIFQARESNGALRSIETSDVSVDLKLYSNVEFVLREIHHYNGNVVTIERITNRPLLVPGRAMLPFASSSSESQCSAIRECSRQYSQIANSKGGDVYLLIETVTGLQRVYLTYFKS